MDVISDGVSVGYCGVSGVGVSSGGADVSDSR